MLDQHVPSSMERIQGCPPPPQHPWRTSPWENASTATFPETPMRLHLLRGIKRVICYSYPQGFLNLSLWGNRCPPVIKTLNYPHLTTVHSIHLCKTVVQLWFQKSNSFDCIGRQNLSSPGLLSPPVSHPGKPKRKEWFWLSKPEAGL